MALLRSVATVGSFTLVSRVFGFIRDILTAAILGAGPVADAFFVAQRLPNLFRSLFAEGAFSAAFVPMASAMLAEGGKPAAREFAEEAFAVLFAVLLVFVALGEIFMPTVMRVVAPGFEADPGKFALVVSLTRITFPYLLFISLTALQGGLLNAVDRFAAPAATPILLNLFLIAGLLLMRHFGWHDGRALAWALTAAGVAQFLWLMMSCARAGVALRLRLPRLTPRVGETLRIMGPGVFGAGVTQINLLISTALASLLPGGSVSYLYYADRLNQLPLGVVGIAIGTAILPPLSRQVRAGDAERRRRDAESRGRTGAVVDIAGGGRARDPGPADPRGAVPARRLRSGGDRGDGGGAGRLRLRAAGLRAGQGAGARLLRPAQHRNPGQGGGGGGGDKPGADPGADAVLRACRGGDRAVGFRLAAGGLPVRPAAPPRPFHARPAGRAARSRGSPRRRSA